GQRKVALGERRLGGDDLDLPLPPLGVVGEGVLPVDLLHAGHLVERAGAGECAGGPAGNLILVAPPGRCPRRRRRQPRATPRRSGGGRLQTLPELSAPRSTTCSKIRR